MDPTRVNLIIIEAGLKFTMSHARGQSRSDFIGRLQDCKSVGGVFELAILGALASKFNEDKLKPFPDLGKGQHADAVLKLGKREVYFECSVLNFSDADIETFELAKLRDGVSITWLKGTGEGRLIQKIEEKFTRYKKGATNVLLLSQYSCLPFERNGLNVLKEYLQVNGGTPPVNCYAGVFYFDRFKCLTWIHNKSCPSEYAISLEESLLLSSAFEKMVP